MVSHPNRRRATKERPAASVSAGRDYSELLSGVRKSFAAATANGERLFLTDADDLYEIYLDALPTARRQEHACHCCRRFIGQYGAVVTISADGEIHPAMWNSDGSGIYDFAFKALGSRVKRSRVVSPFRSQHDTWGTPETGEWSHLSVVPDRLYVHRDRATNAGQAMAAAKENYRTVITALSEFTAPMLDEALRVLESGALNRSERFVGPVKWLRALHDRQKGRKGENALWAAIAAASEGYCHPRASVVGTLLEDIAAGLPFEAVKSRFDTKTAPLQYQRPQAPPSAGNLKAAEELVAKLGLAPSLERRFARVDELQTLWLPKQRESVRNDGAVFGHLKSKADASAHRLSLPTATLTWDKFARTVLPHAEQIELLVPGNGRFIALTTAVNANAPPILKWDSEAERNPVAWYVYPHGSPARQWGLMTGAWAKVTAISPFPNEWGSVPRHYIAEGVVLVLDGAADTRSDAGNALFPECLRDDLHAIRATVEAYSRNAVLGGRENGALACGYDVRKASADCRLRAMSGGAWSEYQVDRWD